MGLFTSFCKKCREAIDWFLIPPKNYKCTCGEEMSEEEIQNSFTDEYEKHMEKKREGWKD